MLDEVLVAEATDRRLDDVGGRDPARRNAPASVLEQECGLGLAAGQAELPRFEKAMQALAMKPMER